MKIYQALCVLILSQAVIGAMLYEDSRPAKYQLLTDGKQPDTVPYVDVQKYKGVWYEQASIPQFFERGCTNTMATYSLRSDGNIQVNNTCIKNGKPVIIIGKATPQDKTNAKLVVQFPSSGNIPGQYWIVRLAEDYSYAVVSNAKYSSLWILSRVKHMPSATFQAIFDDLKKDNFPVDKLQMTLQD